MVEEFEYSKERKKFGRHPQFEDTESKIVGSINPSQNTEPYVLRDPNKLILDNIPQMSEHRVSILPATRPNRVTSGSPPMCRKF